MPDAMRVTKSHNRGVDPRALQRFLIALAAAGGASAVSACSSSHGSCDGFVSQSYTRDMMPEAGAVTQAPGTMLPLQDCESICTDNPGGGSLDSCKTIATDAGATVECTYRTICEGRRPPGLVAACPMESGDEVGDFFAHVAHLEAASVFAFRALAGELRVLRAPRALTRSARRAAQEETRHARATRALARARGAHVAKVERRATAPRSLEEIALENMVEGCVRETWGALLATFQALHAADPHVRAEMKRIARDEARHASLAWSIHRWSEPRLSRRARSEVRRAQDAAIAELRTSLRLSAPSTVLQGARLMPPSVHAVAMFDALFNQLREGSL
jgi:hypothetical protein